MLNRNGYAIEFSDGVRIDLTAREWALAAAIVHDLDPSRHDDEVKSLIYKIRSQGAEPR